MTSVYSRFAKLVSYDADIVDTYLPTWARRSNPVVRRHLGMNWKVSPPEWDVLLNIYLLQVGMVVISFIPLVFNLTAALSVSAILLLPLAFGGYVRLMAGVARDSAHMMADEVREDNIKLLRITTLPLRTILMSKVAACVWKRAELFTLILWAAVMFSLPVLLVEVAGIVRPETYPLFSRAVILFAVTGSIARLFFEPMMVGAVGMLIAAIMPYRTASATWGIAFTAVYFLLVNLPRLLVLPPEAAVMVYYVLPVVVPLLVMLLALRAAEWALTRD